MQSDQGSEKFSISGVLEDPLEGLGNSIKLAEFVADDSNQLPVEKRFEFMSRLSVGELTAVCGDDRLHCKIERISEQNFALAVQAVSSFPAGLHEVPVSIDSVGTQPGGFSRPLTILVLAVDKLDLPSTIFLGDIPLGASVDKTFILRSRSGTPLNLSATSALPGTEVEIRKSVDGKSAGLRVKQIAMEPGIVKGIIDVLLDTDREARRSIPLIYRGVPQQPGDK